MLVCHGLLRRFVRLLPQHRFSQFECSLYFKLQTLLPLHTAGHEVDGSLEHLAVRFKTATAAGEFKTQFEACQEGTATAVVEEGEGGTVEETVPRHSQVSRSSLLGLPTYLMLS